MLVRSYRYLSLLFVLYILFAVGATIGSKTQRDAQQVLQEEDARMNPHLKDEYMDLMKDKYVSLLQASTSADPEFDMNEKLSDAQATQDASTTLGDDIGTFKLQTSDDATDPIEELAKTQEQIQDLPSTITQDQIDQAKAENDALPLQSDQVVEEKEENKTEATNTTEESNSPTNTTENPVQVENATEPVSESTDKSTDEPAKETVDESPHITTVIKVVEEDPDPDNLMFGDGHLENEEEPQDKNREYLTVIFMLGVFALILVIILVRRIMEKYLNEILIARLNSIMKDTIIIITILTFVLYLEFMDVFDKRLDVNGICLAFLIFSLVWLTLSAILIIIGQSFCVRWEEIETLVPKRETILAEYQILYNKNEHGESLSRAEKRQLKHYRIQLEYILMRQEFIAPTFLPIISEAFLRDDFNFAEYLTYSLDRVFGYVFNLTSPALITVIANICLWASIKSQLSYVWNTVTLLIVIIVLCILLRIIAYKFRRIYEDLTTPVDNPLNVMFANFLPFKRDPLACVQSKMPEFLSFDRPLKSQWKLFKDQQLANRQERLFWLGAPKFSIKLVHCLLVTHLIWTLIFVSDFWFRFDVWGEVLLGIVVFALLILDVFYLIPMLIRQYCVISHIQMKRDFSLIEKVVLSQRRKTRSVIAKFYRLLKSSRKEILKDSNSVPKLKPFLEKQIVDAFNILNDNNESKIIKLQDLSKLVHLCGKEIKRDELLYLAREATKDDYQSIHLDDLIRAVEFLSQDVKLEPYATSREVLRSLTENENHISLRELGKIIADHKVLSKEDISSILHELRYLSWDGQEVEIDHIAAYIRHNLECMPR